MCFFLASQFLIGAAIAFTCPGHQKNVLRHCPHTVGSVKSNKFRPIKKQVQHYDKHILYITDMST